MPPRDPDQRLKEQGRFGIADFRYDAAADLYRCPANAELRPMSGRKRKASGKLVVRYAIRQAVCRDVQPNYSFSFLLGKPRYLDCRRPPLRPWRAAQASALLCSVVR